MQHKMLFKKMILSSVVILFLSLSSCSYYVSREGYKKSEIVKKADSCKVYIYKDLNNAYKLKKIGSISLKDAGFAINCNEDDAIAFLKKEACEINANIVNITKEASPERGGSTCYRCDADFYLDTNNIIIDNNTTYYPRKRREYSPFHFLPFNYGYFHGGIDYITINQNYWKELLNKYNLPAENSSPTLAGIGYSVNINDFYYDLSVSYVFSYGNIKDSLKSLFHAYKVNLDFGYNILNHIVTISPFIGLRYLYQNHIIALNDDNISIDRWVNTSDKYLYLQQYSGVIGVNIVYPFWLNMSLSINSGYNFNFQKYPSLYSNQSEINNPNIQLMKNFFFRLSFGVAYPFNDIYYKQYYYEDE